MGLSRDANAAVLLDIHGPKPNHRGVFRRDGEEETRKEVALATTAHVPFVRVLPDDDLGGALPAWAEELRGCDLPACPVCALARRGFLCE